MKPKDLLEYLESGNRTADDLKVVPQQTVNGREHEAIAQQLGANAYPRLMGDLAVGNSSQWITYAGKVNDSQLGQYMSYPRWTAEQRQILESYARGEMR